MHERPFSEELERWLKSKRPKTLEDLSEVFGEKTFAIAFILLLAPSSLPIPTGGLTNLFEIVAFILAIEMIAGMRTIWLPKKLLSRKLGHATQKKAIPFIIKRVRWFEKLSKPRLKGFLQNRASLSLIGLMIFVFTLGAFIAPLFSGLDTLPSLGVVIVALSLILEDSLLLVIGTAVGTIGISLELALSAAIFQFFDKIF